jgi:hypothetical protein
MLTIEPSRFLARSPISFNTCLFFMSILRTTSNHMPFKYKCPNYCGVWLKHVYLEVTKPKILNSKTKQNCALSSKLNPSRNFQKRRRMHMQNCVDPTLNENNNNNSYATYIKFTKSLQEMRFLHYPLRGKFINVRWESSIKWGYYLVFVKQFLQRLIEKVDHRLAIFIGQRWWSS